MRKISVLLAAFVIVATSLASCKETAVYSNEFGKEDTTAVVVDSTVVIDSSNVDSILQKK